MYAKKHPPAQLVHIEKAEECAGAATKKIRALVRGTGGRIWGRGTGAFLELRYRVYSMSPEREWGMETKARTDIVEHQHKHEPLAPALRPAPPLRQAACGVGRVEYEKSRAPWSSRSWLMLSPKPRTERRVWAEAVGYASSESLGSDAFVASWYDGSCGRDWVARISPVGE